MVSGLWSPIYIQLRVLSCYPELLKTVGHAMGKMIKEEAGQVDKLIGVAMAGIPIAAAISICEGIPSGFTRKLEGVKTYEELANKIQEYGEHGLIEGDLKSNDKIVVVDDLVTRFDSKLLAIKQVEYEAKKRKLENVRCQDVAVLFDREQGAKERAQEHGINLYALIPFRSRGLDWLKEAGKISEEERKVIEDYFNNPPKYQDAKIQMELAERAKQHLKSI
jgi:orotate phosphoribosyltransferase